jgi:anti-sigma factor RsiW
MHPETELTGYLTDTLAPAERARVAEHLQTCAECRRALEESRAVLAGLAAAPAVPEPDWGR